MNNRRISDLSDLGLPLYLARPVQFNLAPVVAEGAIQAVITSRELADEFVELSGAQPGNFPISTRIFDFSERQSDDVIVCSAGGGLPLVIRRDGEVIVNFDMRAIPLCRFAQGWSMRIFLLLTFTRCRKESGVPYRLDQNTATRILEFNWIIFTNGDGN